MSNFKVYEIEVYDIANPDCIRYYGTSWHLSISVDIEGHNISIPTLEALGMAVRLRDDTRPAPRI